VTDREIGLGRLPEEELDEVIESTRGDGVDGETPATVLRDRTAVEDGPGRGDRSDGQR